MKFLSYILALTMALLLSGCQKEAVEYICEDSKIYLRACVETPLGTKVPVMDNPGKGNQLNVAVWATSTDNVFIHEDGSNGSGNTKVAIHTKGHFTSTEPQLLADAIYPNEGGTVYFTAFHPQTDSQTDGQTGWTTTDGTDATFTFTGAEDVMFAPETSGTYGTAYDNSPVLNFKHLLTLLTINIKAENEDVSDAWGKIESFTVKSKNNIKISNLGSASTFTFSNDTDFTVYGSGTENIFPPDEGFPIPYGNSYSEVAYVMCSPVDAIAPNPNDDTVNSADYTFTIKTENRDITVPVDLKNTSDSYFTGSTMGWHFTINILFKMGDKITVTATVNDWETGGTGSGEING